MPTNPEDCAPTHPPAGPRSHLPSLTALRFGAAMLVVLYHEARPLLPQGPVRQLAANGFMGVGLFFVLSGFILAYTYLEPFDTPRVEKQRFWSARFARVYPVYLLGLVVALPLYLPWVVEKLRGPGILEPVKAVTTTIANLTLLQGWIPQTVSSWNAPGWSLSVEACFYLLFPFVAVRLTRRSNRTIALTAAIVWTLGLLVAVGFLVAHPELWRGGEPDSVTPGLLFLKFFPLEHLPEFVIGIACGIFFLRASATRRPPSMLPGALSVIVSAVLLAVLAAPAQLPYPLLHSGLLAPLFALLILTLATEQGPLGSLLRHRPLVLLGKASYAIYLLHEPIAAILYKREWSPLRDTDPWIRFLVYVAIVIAVSIAVLQWYEEPARRLLRNGLGGSRRSTQSKGNVRLAPVRVEETG